jgi:hypothetical protein
VLHDLKFFENTYFFKVFSPSGAILRQKET